jgi:murein DD-endopeptidase MepM/ murein hydrolase activator NlpD
MGPPNGRSGALLLLLALIGGAWIWLQSGRDTEARLSRWGAIGTVAEVGATMASGLPGAAGAGLSGVAQQQGRGLPGDMRPQGNPLQAPNTVMTQGYGVGTHAPSATWGAVDLAIDGDYDGAADPEGSWNHPIYATHDGLITVTPNSYPAGNHVWVANDEYRTGYSHLADFNVVSGQWVRRGELIGHMGSTGMSSGPHLDYQVWARANGAWVNVDPLEFGALEGTGR